jgi:hypothetical protein
MNLNTASGSYLGWSTPNTAKTTSSFSFDWLSAGGSGTFVSWSWKAEGYIS